jgi:hypothetical protein
MKLFNKKEAGESAIKIARKWAYEVKGVPSNQAEVLFAKGKYIYKIIRKLLG